jgi:hypothetical protein
MYKMIKNILKKTNQIVINYDKKINEKKYK